MSKDLSIEKALKKFLKTPILIDENMEDFSNHPDFIARSKQAAEFIAKNGPPKSFKKKPKKSKSLKRKA
jgi:hypothetical protein